MTFGELAAHKGILPPGFDNGRISPAALWEGWQITPGSLLPDEDGGGSMFSPPHLLNRVALVVGDKAYYASAIIFVEDIERCLERGLSLADLGVCKMESAYLALQGALERDGAI